MPPPHHDGQIAGEARHMQHRLGNDRFEIVIDDEACRIARLRNVATGDDYINTGLDYSMCQLVCIDEDSNDRFEAAPRCAPAGARARVDTGERVEIEYEACEVVGGSTGPTGSACSACEGDCMKGRSSSVRSARLAIRVSVRAQACPGDAESVWSVRVANNQPGVRVIQVLFPRLRGVYLGDSWRDDVMIYPHHAGEKTQAPIEEYTTPRYLNFGRAQSIRDGNGVYSREINYCGLASMNWMYYHDDQNGLYLASYDPEFIVTGLRVETGGPDCPDGPWMGWAFRKHVEVRTGQTWESPDYGIAVTRDDWRWGAKRYRQWADTVMPMPDNPDFLEDEHVLNQCYNFKRDGVIFNKFRDIPRMYEDGRARFGARHMFIASWNRKGFDQNYPEYYPDMELGTAWELAEGCEYVNEHGGFVTFYINSRIFEKTSDYFNSLGVKWAIEDENGEMIHESYGPHNFVVLCPSHDEWKNYLMDVAGWMVKCSHATGIYLDQLGSAQPWPCFDPEHTHASVGEFNRGYLELVRNLLARLRSINPDSFLMIENCGDIYGSYVWGNLTWNGEPYDEFFNLYKYTFPEYVQVNMVNPRRDLDGRERAERLHHDLDRALMLGSVFWLGLDKMPYLEDDTREYLDAALRLRARLTPLIRGARYVDMDGVASVSYGLQVGHWVMADGRDLYIVVNPGRVADGVVVVSSGRGVNADGGASSRGDCQVPSQACSQAVGRTCDQALAQAHDCAVSDPRTCKRVIVDDFDIDGGSGRVCCEPCSEGLRVRLHDAEVVCILTE